MTQNLWNQSNFPIAKFLNYGSENVTKPTESSKEEDNGKVTSMMTTNNDTERQAKLQAEQIAVQSDPSSDDIQKALQLKEQGNTFFANKEWQQALDYYTKAIQIHPKEATFYSNRSTCYVNVQQPTNGINGCGYSMYLTSYME